MINSLNSISEVWVTWKIKSDQQVECNKSAIHHFNFEHPVGFLRICRKCSFRLIAVPLSVCLAPARFMSSLKSQRLYNWFYPSFKWLTMIFTFTFILCWFFLSFNSKNCTLPQHVTFSLLVFSDILAVIVHFCWLMLWSSSRSISMTARTSSSLRFCPVRSFWQPVLQVWQIVINLKR